MTQLKEAQSLQTVPTLPHPAKSSTKWYRGVASVLQSTKSVTAMNASYNQQFYWHNGVPKMDVALHTYNHDIT